MNEQTIFNRIASISAITAALAMIAASLVAFIAVDFDTEPLANPGILINIGSRAASIFRWGEILGLFGWGLLLIPVALYLWFWLHNQSPRLVAMYTVFGFTGILFTAFGSILRAIFFPSMMAAFAQASAAQREFMQIIFQAITDFSFEGILALEYLFWGLWWVGIGLVLRHHRRWLGFATMILGVASLGGGLGWLLQIYLLARFENLLFLLPIWAIWLGVVIWRRDDGKEAVMEPATPV